MTGPPHSRSGRVPEPPAPSGGQEPQQLEDGRPQPPTEVLLSRARHGRRGGRAGQALPWHVYSVRSLMWAGYLLHMCAGMYN